MIIVTAILPAQAEDGPSDLQSNLTIKGFDQAKKRYRVERRHYELVVSSTELRSMMTAFHASGGNFDGQEHQFNIPLLYWSNQGSFETFAVTAFKSLILTIAAAHSATRHGTNILVVAPLIAEIMRIARPEETAALDNQTFGFCDGFRFHLDGEVVSDIELLVPLERYC